MKKITIINKLNTVNLNKVLAILAIFVVVVGVSNMVLAKVETSTTTSPVTEKAVVSFETLPENTVFNDFVVGPGKVQIDIAPGESKTFELTIANRLGTEKTFSIVEEDFVGSNDPDKTVVLLGNDRGPYSLKDYLKIGTSSIDIPHAVKSRVLITVSVPKNAQPGGLYGSVVIGTVSKAGDNSSSTGVNTTNPIITRIGTLVFVRVAGAVKESGELTGFILAGNHKFISGGEPVVFDLLYKNSGNIHLNPSGTITINNLLGSNVGNIKVEPWFAMPNSLRFREVEWKAPFLFGRYTAHAVIERGYGDLKDEMSVTFWIVPWKMMLMVIAGLVVFIGLVRWIFKKFKITRK
ncbi:MAG: hypothetical protein WCS89_03360 [Candidatus Paceibacterota bacterium]